MNRQNPDEPSANTRHSKLAWLGLGSMTCAVAAMAAAFFSALDPKIALDAARIDAAAALARSGFSWAQVEIEDSVAIIQGEAPGEPERVMAFEVVSKALRPAMHETNVVDRVRSQLTIAAAPPATVIPERAVTGQNEPPMATAEPPIAQAQPEQAQPEQRVAAMEPAAAPVQSWTAPPVQYPNGPPVMPVTAMSSPSQQAAPATASIETASVDKAATPAPSACMSDFAATLSASGIVFASNSAEIDKQSRPVLDKLAGIAKRCSRFHFAIEGHTDGQGGKAHNLALSQRRAEAVRTALINRGVDMDHIGARGYGSARPIEQGASTATLAKNRRIEITVSERKAAAMSSKTQTSRNDRSKH